MFIKKTQLPIAPAFAMTAHSAQGKTETAVIADLQVGRGVSSTASYIAITRVKSRKGLLIFRPFDREPYTQGVSEGTALLLTKIKRRRDQLGRNRKTNDSSEKVWYL